MRVLQTKAVLALVLVGLTAPGFSGCGSSNGGGGTDGPSGAGGTHTGGSGGATGGSGGATATGGTGGSTSTGGSGGATATGGTGGSTSTGGSGGTTATGGTGGATGACVKGQIQPSEVLFIGDSFIALNNSIPTALEAHARAAGSLSANAHYRNNAVSGTTLANNQIPSQYTDAVNASSVKVVLMDGGGNDCLQRNDPNGAYDAAVSLFQTMAQQDTASVVYFFYPDPLKGYLNSTLTSCLNTLRPRIRQLCEGLTAPKCYFIDLRPGWTDADVLSDGIHPTTQGGQKVAQQIWATMQEQCIAQ